MQNSHQSWSTYVIPTTWRKKKYAQYKNVNICTSLCRFNALSVLSSRRTQRITVNPILISGKAMEQLILETISRYNEGKKTIRSSQNDFTKVKAWQTKAEQSRLSLWTSIKPWTQSHHNILQHKLLMHRLDKYTLSWTESCLNSLAKGSDQQNEAQLEARSQQCSPWINTVP